VLRLGVIGCGLIARRSHLPGFAKLPDAEITELTSAHIANARSAADEFGGLAVSRWQDLVASDNVDAVVVCTPNALHAEMAIAAARAGKHVLVEKPMAVAVEEADAMIEASRAAGVVLMVAHSLRFVPAFEAVRNIVADGVIGRVLSARGVFMHAGPDESWGATSDWFWRKDLAGGGSLIDLGVHIIDLVRWILGGRVTEVTAMTSRLLKPTEADDNASVLMRFEDGVVATVQTGWTARPSGDRQIAVYGEAGTVSTRPSRTEPVVAQLTDGSRVVPSMPPAVDLCRHFVDCVRTGAEPLTSGREGRDTLAVALAAYESARTGAVVRVRR
jgi:predicted dehydrogenase